MAQTTAQRLNMLQDKLLTEQFVHNTGLGNEVGFYIFDYAPQDELLVRTRVPEIRRYTEKQLQVKVQNFDLFTIVLQFFEARGYMDKNFQMEAKRGSAILFERMQKALKLATNRDELVSYIATHYDPNAIIF
ncbi:BREX protein BrxB domain-containing protein [Loigolactobacillus coryniformis]|nr:BREX protein BrxB domain-containing protein [Loigolactobacillus coryniformis]